MMVGQGTIYPEMLSLQRFNTSSPPGGVIVANVTCQQDEYFFKNPRQREINEKILFQAHPYSKSMRNDNDTTGSTGTITILRGIPYMPFPQSSIKTMTLPV